MKELTILRDTWKLAVTGGDADENLVQRHLDSIRETETTRNYLDFIIWILLRGHPLCCGSL